MNVRRALTSGLAGASALTTLDEVTRRFVSSAPRLDVLGKRTGVYALHAVTQPAPDVAHLPTYAFIGDLALSSCRRCLVSDANLAHGRRQHWF